MSTVVETELCSLMHKYGSDKCPRVHHTYSPVYYELLHPYKHTWRNILEIGVGNCNLMIPIVGDTYQPGASLRVWRDFFSNAMIYSFDIDRNVLFSEERIHCVYTDQSNAHALRLSVGEVAKHTGKTTMLFDCIIDDGSHIPHDMMLSIRTLFPYLEMGGIYIIEDIKRGELQHFAQLTLPNMRVLHVHEGVNNWDSFVAYIKE